MAVLGRKRDAMMTRWFRKEFIVGDDDGSVDEGRGCGKGREGSECWGDGKWWTSLERRTVAGL